MPFTIKHNKRIKFKGVWNTTTLDTLLGPPPHLGETLSSMIQEKIKGKKKKKKKKK